MLGGLLHPCPCCGYRVFAEPPGSYAICPICGWEDDALQLEFATTLDGGANPVTLELAQKEYAASEAKLRLCATDLLPPRPSEDRDFGWRLIDCSLDDFAEWGGRDRERVPEPDERLYYWRETFWRRGDRFT